MTCKMSSYPVCFNRDLYNCRPLVAKRAIYEGGQLQHVVTSKSLRSETLGQGHEVGINDISSNGTTVAGSLKACYRTIAGIVKDENQHLNLFLHGGR